jgi:phosphoglycerol transferase MdoB-like AlkP superfamily enzyme
MGYLNTHKGVFLLSKPRKLIVVEHKESGQRFLHDPFIKGQKIVPDGYRKITQTVPLNEEKYGHLPLLKLN